MTLPDAINASLECLSSVFVWLSIRQLWRDKRVRGVAWSHYAFIVAWGMWNCYYYPSLGQWASFWGGVAMLFSNMTYFGMLLYYVCTEKKTAEKDCPSR